MKASISIFVLICGCIVSTYAQINLHSRTQSSTTDSARLNFDIPIGRFKIFSSPDVIMRSQIGEPILPNGRGEGKALDNRMPCYAPEGKFSMRIILPDPGMKYTMLIE